MPDSTLNETGYKSWIPPGCRRVLEIGLYGCIAFYAVFFAIGMAKVWWEDYRTLFIGVMVFGGIPALIVVVSIYWYLWTSAPARRMQPATARSTSLVSRLRSIAGLLVFSWIVFLVLAFVVSVAQTVWSVNLTFFTFVCVPVGGIPLMIALLVLSSYVLLFVQAGAMNRYAQMAVNVSEDEVTRVIDMYQQQPDTPQKFIMLAQLSRGQDDLDAAETYLRRGLALVKKCRFCFVQPTVYARWFSAGLHDELVGLLLQQGRFADAAESMREHLPTYVFPNAGTLVSAWCYFLADDKDNARVMLARVQPIKFLRRLHLGIFIIERNNNEMSHQTAISSELQCLIPYLQVNLHGQFDPAALEIRASDREVWDQVAKLDSVYGEYVRALLPTMYTVWDLYGIGPTPEAEPTADQTPAG